MVINEVIIENMLKNFTHKLFDFIKFQIDSIKMRIKKKVINNNCIGFLTKLKKVLSRTLKKCAAFQAMQSSQTTKFRQVPETQPRLQFATNM